MTTAHPRRHELVWLRRGWRRHLVASGDPALLAEAERWFALGRPAVGARRDPDAPPDAVALGLALPGPGKRRLALLVSRSAIARVAPPLRLGAALASAPAPWRAPLRALDAEARLAGVPLSVYGTLAWQHLSGERYLTARSDVDLLAPGHTPLALRAALELLGRHAGDRTPPLDGEVLLGGGRGVAWRELLARPGRVLVKSTDAVRLEAAAPLLASGAEAVDRAAIGALRDELAAFPKPGLVSLVDAGAHRDMDARVFLASLRALRGFFGSAARAGLEGAPFAVLRALGLAAEARMLRATGGVNTHRGAIFTLGLLAAAAGRAARAGVAPLRAEVGALGREVARELPVDAASHGARASRRHRVPGAREEAMRGLPHVFDVALPALEASLARGAPPNAAAVQALFAVVAVLPDTNLLHRGGAAGLELARAGARRFLRAGGVHRLGWEGSALALHRDLVRRRLSPGGSADVLAGALLVRRLTAST